MVEVLPVGSPLPHADPAWNADSYHTAMVSLDVALARDSLAALQENWGKPHCHSPYVTFALGQRSHLLVNKVFFPIRFTLSVILNPIFPSSRLPYLPKVHPGCVHIFFNLLPTWLGEK